MFARALRTAAPALRPLIQSRGLAQMTLVGRITTPEKQQTKNGETFHKFSIADRVRTSEGEHESAWYRVVCFEPSRQEYIAGLGKGDLVYVVADVVPAKYEKDGQIVNVYNLTASE